MHAVIARMAQRRERSTRRRRLSPTTLLQSRIQRLGDITEAIEQSVAALKKATGHDNETAQPARAVINKLADSMRAMAYSMNKTHDGITEEQTSSSTNEMNDFATISENVVTELKLLIQWMESESFRDEAYVARTLNDMANRIETAS